MRQITLGITGITTCQNAFGALPIQRVSMEEAVKILRKAYEGGMTFFDTARAYSDSEEKVGEAFEGLGDKIFIATKTMAKTPEEFWKQLETSLKNLRRESIDIYQFHCVSQCYRPGDGTGMYECMQEAKAQGKIRHIGVTAHKLSVAEECVKSGLYETLQFPFSYLSSEKEVALVNSCKEAGMGFIAMKALAGGLIHDSKAAMGYISQFDNVLPIWGVQRMEELLEWLAFMEETPEYTEEIREYVEKEREDLAGEFCRGCGYCMPCPVGIQINQCARINLMARRAPAAEWLNDYWQGEMKKIENCLHCGKCASKCPYGLDTPQLLQDNYKEYWTHF